MSSVFYLLLCSQYSVCIGIIGTIPHIKHCVAHQDTLLIQIIFFTGKRNKLIGNFCSVFSVIISFTGASNKFPACHNAVIIKVVFLSIHFQETVLHHITGFIQIIGFTSPGHHFVKYLRSIDAKIRSSFI